MSTVSQNQHMGWEAIITTTIKQNVLCDFGLFLYTTTQIKVLVALHAKVYDPNLKNVTMVSIWSWSPNVEPCDQRFLKKCSILLRFYQKSLTKIQKMGLDLNYIFVMATDWLLKLSPKGTLMYCKGRLVSNWK